MQQIRLDVKIKKIVSHKETKISPKIESKIKIDDGMGTAD